MPTDSVSTISDCLSCRAARGAQGCPAEQGPAAQGAVLGQGLCCLPGTALSQPWELLTALGDEVRVEGESWKGLEVFSLCGEDAALFRAASSMTFKCRTFPSR